jgi:hypothetical protein
MASKMEAQCPNCGSRRKWEVLAACDPAINKKIAQKHSWHGAPGPSAEQFYLQTIDVSAWKKAMTYGVDGWQRAHIFAFAEAYAASETAALRKYEALYAEAREVLCSCNHTDTPEKGPGYNYTCEWCEQHPEGAEPPPVIKTMWALEEQAAVLREVLTTIAGFAVGNGDVCEIIARLWARAALGEGKGGTP